MGKKTIYLDRNENNYGPAPLCLDVLKKADFTHISFYSKVYERGIKSILSERIAKEFNVDEKHVLLGYGAEDLLKQVVQCYMDETKKLMVPAYSWWYYKAMANEVNGKSVEYPITIGEDTFNYDVEAMLNLYDKKKPSVILISSPNNPTGNSLAGKDLIRILDYMKNSIVVLDEAYWYESPNSHIKNLVEKYPNILVIRTFSKYYALAGIRIGFALIGENHKNLMKFTNRYLGYNRLSEEIAIAALDSPGYYKNIAEKMYNDKKLYYEELGKLKGFTVYKSDANFILVKIPKSIKESLKKFLLQRGLVIKFMNEELLNSHLRITLGTTEQNRMVIDNIKEFCENEII